MKQILIIFGLLISVTTFAQSPRIKLNQITKDSLTGSVLISSPTDSGMVYSRDLFISYGADTFLILGGDTLAATSSIISSVLSDGVTITGDGTVGSPLKVDTTTVIATKGDLSDYVTVAGTQTITGAKTFSTDVEIDGKLDLEADGNSVFIGEDAGRVDDGGDNRNVGVGYRALYSNIEGNNNAAYGYFALYSNTDGYENMAVGNRSLNLNKSGSNNAAYGSRALQDNTSGSKNVGIGDKALQENTTGNQNTSIGQIAGRSTSTGANNTDGDNSVFIGYDARPLADAQENQIVIGSEARGLGSNSVVLGNSSITKTRLQGDVGIGTDSPSYDLEVTGKIYASDSIISAVFAGVSDIRLKQDVESSDKGLDAVMELNPVSYRLISNADNEKKSYGFIAQEVEKVIPDVIGTRHDGMKIMNYNDLISVLTKAIQEQQAIIKTQTNEIEQLKALISDLSNRLTILENN
jgi:hypothetical protein